jgi:hypothetical protein
MQEVFLIINIYRRMQPNHQLVRLGRNQSEFVVVAVLGISLGFAPNPEGAEVLSS